MAAVRLPESPCRAEVRAGGVRGVGVVVVRRSLAAVVGALLIAHVALACAPRGEPGCPRHDGAVRVALAAMPVTLDWNKSHESSWQNYPVLHAMMQGLTTLDADNRPAPGLATSWDVESLPGGGQRYVFHLRPGVVWSDGRTPLVAEDFVVGWRRAMAGHEPAEMAEIDGVDAVIAARGRADLAPAARARLLAEAIAGVAIAAPDPSTFVVTLKTPASYFLSRIAYVYPFFPAPSAELRDLDDVAVARYFDLPANGRPLTVGAYTVSSWDRPAKQVTLQKNPHFWDAHADRPAVLELSTADLAPVLYDRCALDFLTVDEPTLVAATRSAADARTSPLLSTVWLGMNADRVDEHLRRAIAAALDRPALFAGLIPDARVAGGLLPPSLPGGVTYDDADAAGLPTFSLARATEELRHANYDGRTLTLLVKNGSTFVPEVGLGDAIRRQLGVVGIDVKVVTTANFTGDIKDAAGRVRHDLFLRRIGADYAHPQTFFTMFAPRGNHYTSLEHVDGGAAQKSLVAGLRAAAGEMEPTRMAALYGALQKDLLATAVVVPLLHPDRTFRARAWLAGATVDPFNFVSLARLRVLSSSPSPSSPSSPGAP
jgi:peptide/nickel transport system substrate-binding protein